MLRIELVAVGTKPPAWIQEGIDSYVSRMQRECRFSIREVRTSDRKKPMSVDGHRQKEATGLLAALKPDAWVVALDGASGRNLSTEELAQKMADKAQVSSDFQFVIGGPDGLDKACLQRADDIWSLSRLTFPHFVVRVLLAEQIYRALMVNANHPYHK